MCMCPDIRKSDFHKMSPLKFHFRWILCKLLLHKTRPLNWLREFNDPNYPKWHNYQCINCRKSRMSNLDFK